MRASQRRRRAIQQLVRRRKISTQQELVEALEDLGFPVSQASVSRDITALRLVKVDGCYAPPAQAVPEDDPRQARLKASVLGVRTAGENLVVLITPPGEASAVGLAIDDLDLPGLVGSVAGDDTVFVAVDTPPGAASFAGSLARRLHLRD
ncbi:MAG: arginine repressor [Acidobacteriota bacterium]|nr:arginine repressor [Acidobacteriota bacterium]